MRVRYAVAAAVLAAFVAAGATTAAVYVYAGRPARGTSPTRQAEAQRPALAPAFTAAQLSALPRDAWITNGGSLANQRYSPLTQIDTSNVQDLKGVWHTHLRGSAMAAKYSAEGQPIVYDGVIYVPTGEDDVFAVSVATGKILWQYQANLDQRISTVCCGWESRGVGLGEGKVYLGQLDGKLVALDQKTGKVAWTTRVDHWQRGFTMTAAPLYYDGRVIVGVSGGEFEIRGRVMAFDAKTGKEVWRFYTVPGPGEPGGDTWPKGTDAYLRGGAPVWQTPSVDPELGLLYFSTGNAAPDLDGTGRAGDNLFTASIVALDARTGKYRWHFQEVHHDIWDYDAPSPTILFDVKLDGKLRHGLAEPGKSGWLYLLDRTNGKPLFPIPEKPVPQNAEQKTAKTQPFPSYRPFVTHEVSDEAFEQVRKLVQQQTKDQDVVVKRASQMFAPVTRTMTVFVPGPQGGTNWPPASYNPKTQMFYVCGQEGPSAYSYSPALTKDVKPKQVAVAKLGGVLVLPGFGSNPGTLTAIDATSGDIAWQKRWPESCYSGTVTTAGDLVFVGRSTGDLEAYDARKGNRLWRFGLGAGANTTATIFQDADGKEKIVFYAGGNALAASPHGDSLWLLSLDGRLGPVKLSHGGAGVEHAGAAPEETSTKGDAAAGKKIFADNCATCHGASGHGGNGGPDLTAIPDAKKTARVVGQVTNGGGGMPSFKGSLTRKQINDVAAYVTQKIAGGNGK